MSQFTILVSLLLLMTAVHAQQTGYVCADPIVPQSVPAGVPPLDFFSGTWYTIGTCEACTSPDNVCTQVAYVPEVPTNPLTNLTYTGSFNSGGQPSSELAQAFGLMRPQDTTTVDYPYQFDLTLVIPGEGPVVLASRFWVIGAANFDDSGNPTAIVTYSCGLPAGQGGATDNAQIFFLSRKPFFNDGVTFQNLETLAKTAIGADNYAAFNITTVSQQQNWCNYALGETPIDFAGGSSCDDDDIETAAIFSKAATGISAVVLTLVLGLVAQGCMKGKDGPSISAK